MEAASITAVDTVVTDVGTAVDTVGTDVGVLSPETVVGAFDEWPSESRAGGGIPATRHLWITLYSLLALVAATVAAGLLLGDGAAATAAFAVAASGLAVAVAIRRAITTLTPAALRARRDCKRIPVRVAVVGPAASVLDLRNALRDAGVGGVEVVGAVATDAAPEPHWLELGGLADLRRIVEREAIDLLLTDPGIPRARVVDEVIRSCLDEPVCLCDVSAFYEDVFGRVPIRETDTAWLQCVLHPRYRERRSQRVVDIAVAGALTVILLPLLGFLVLLVRWDGGPAFFRQSRIGRDGRPFVIYKLRTMRPEGRSEPARWAEDGDPRVTSLGRLLRRTHLDELPQLANVLRGEMTLVGPRPEQPEIAARLDEALPLWRGRHRYKPGVTGWAQVRCGYSGSDEGSAIKLAHDLYYLRRQSFALDVAVLAQTAAMLLMARCYAQVPATPFVVRRAPHATGSVELDRPPPSPPAGAECGPAAADPESERARLQVAAARPMEDPCPIAAPSSSASSPRSRSYRWRPPQWRRRESSVPPAQPPTAA